MKKAVLAISAFLFLAAGPSLAQVRADAGYLHSMMFDYSNGYRANAQGFYAGAAYTYDALPYGLEAGAGLYYGYIGGKGLAILRIMEDPVYSTVSKFGSNSREEYCLAVPLNAGITAHLGDVVGLHASFGPVFTWCLDSRSYSYWADDLGAEVERNVSYFAPENNFVGYSRFDILAGGSVGVDFFGKVRLHAGAYYGLLNRSGHSNKNLHTLSMQAGVSYLF